MPRSAFDARAGYRKSYWKTIVATAAVGGGSVLLGLAIVLRFWPPTGAGAVGARAAWTIILVALAVIFLWTSFVAAGGLIALRRETLEAAGLPYASIVPRESRPSVFGLWLRRIGRRRDDSHSLQLIPGEDVEVRRLDEILATLDDHGTLDGLPFMPEMVAYCGKRAKVFRRVDKLNDWIHGAGLKRVYDTVQLDLARCSGTAHGGCQSSCRLRWKEAWLQRPDSSSSPHLPSPTNATLTESDLHRIARRDGADGTTHYVCQATELANTGEHIAWDDPRHLLRDWATGNVRLQPLMTGVAIATFNWAQRKRRGVMFPCMEPSSSKSSPSESLGLRPGDWVRVKPKHRIGETLNDRNRNRGLRFDLEMLRFCGGTYRVSAVLDRVIVESTGELKQLTIPCIVLEGVRASGEYRGFNPEDEHIFWREIWLERAEPPRAE
jgi:hypothetical protein